MFSPAGDIWSFGVLLWEIVTLGATPYPKTSIRNVKRRVEGGQTMLRPEHCGDSIYEIMQECWKFEPDERPKFPKIVKMLEKLIEPSSNQPLYLELMQEDIYTPAQSLHEDDITLEESIFRQTTLSAAAKRDNSQTISENPPCASF